MLSQEAIRGHRRKSEHKDLLHTLVQKMTKPDNEMSQTCDVSEIRTRDLEVDARSGDHLSKKGTCAIEPAEEYLVHQSAQGDEGYGQAV